MDVKGLAAVVTGGASGLGRATATKLVEAGAKVALFDRNIDLARETAAALGGDTIAVEVDVSSAESAEAAFAAAMAANGPTRVCINCAGIGGSVRIIDRQGKPMELDHFRKIIEVNQIGTFNTLRLAAAQMASQEPVNEDGIRGAIVNTASVAGYEGQIGQAAYASSKGGVIALTICAARDLASFGIRVNTIAPGIMMTPLLESLPEETLGLLGKQVPYPKRTGHAHEYASMAMELVRNDYMNGETIRVDGAIRMGPR
jgi:NAD(P)-dependent dehydrogenase (short-subunit alcohol dehydrogenase family)